MTMWILLPLLGVAGYVWMESMKTPAAPPQPKLRIPQAPYPYRPPLSAIPPLAPLPDWMVRPPAPKPLPTTQQKVEAQIQAAPYPLKRSDGGPMPPDLSKANALSLESGLLKWVTEEFGRTWQEAEKNYLNRPKVKASGWPPPPRPPHMWIRGSATTGVFSDPMTRTSEQVPGYEWHLVRASA